MVVKIVGIRRNGRRMCFNFNVLNNNTIVRGGVDGSPIAVIFVGDIPKGNFKCMDKNTSVGAIIDGGKGV